MTSLKSSSYCRLIRKWTNETKNQFSRKGALQNAKKKSNTISETGSQIIFAFNQRFKRYIASANDTPKMHSSNMFTCTGETQQKFLSRPLRLWPQNCGTAVVSLCLVLLETYEKIDYLGWIQELYVTS